MKITKLICFALAAVLLLCSAAACTNKKKKDDKPADKPPESDYNWNVPIGDDVPKNEDFNNTDNNNSNTYTPTPGQNSGTVNNTVNNNGNSGNNGGGSSAQEPEDDSKIESDFAESVLADNDSLLFYYEKDSYAYGITEDNEEIIAFRDRSGKLVDALQGAGKYKLVSETGGNIVSNYSVSDFTQTISNGNVKLTVNYKPVNSSADVNYSVEYTFFENNIKIEASIDYNGDAPAAASKSSITRYFFNGYESADKSFNTDWCYPDDGDYPYKEMDAWCTVHNIDDYNRMYTFLRSSNIPNYYWDYYSRYPQNSIPVFGVYDAASGTYSDKAEYSIVFENCDEKDNPDYRALFKGKNMPVAAGIAPVTANTENSTVFSGDSVSLNLNVANLTDEKVLFSYRYDIRDYYGNIADSGLYINSEVFANRDANRIINFKPGYYGIFFLNIMIVTENGSYYREYYPFALVEKYEYMHNDTSPFGIGQILGGKNEPYNDYLELAAKIGVATIRATPLSVSDMENSEAYIKKAQEKKMRIFATGNGNKYYIDTFSKYGIKEFVSGNELNVPAIDGSVDINTAFTNYVKDYFNPGYENIKQQGYKYIIAAVGGGQTEWFERINSIGGWNKFDVIALHPYGYPYSPDLPVTNNIWHVEDSLKRNKSATERFGYKETYVTETGYPTMAGDKRAVDLRTQADYNMRCYMLCLAYGASRVMAYCFTDYANAGVGVDAVDKEFNFGAFYYPDYFGRILPKPSAVMYANMTRQLESVKSAEINSKYDNGDKLRAFTLKTALDGDVIVAWSNCSRLPNDAVPITRPDREYLKPWENQWHGSENVTFNTNKSTVEVIDTMGNSKTYKAENGKVTIALNGSPVIIKGVY